MAPPTFPSIWIVNLTARQVEVYTNPTSEGYALRTDYASGTDIPLVIDGITVGLAVADILP
jgi:hypothetical protein